MVFLEVELGGSQTSSGFQSDGPCFSGWLAAPETLIPECCLVVVESVFQGLEMVMINNTKDLAKVLLLLLEPSGTLHALQWITQMGADMFH